MFGERSGHTQHSSPLQHPERTSIPTPLPFGKPAHREKCPGWDSGTRVSFFLVIPINFSLSGRLGQGALQSHCVLAKCFGNAVSHSEFG